MEYWAPSGGSGFQRSVTKRLSAALLTMGTFCEIDARLP